MNYVYCVINKGVKQSFKETGVEDKKVYTVPYKGLSLAVHDSSKEPELDEEDYLISHQYVIDFLTKRFNTVIPFNINTFIRKEKIETFLEKNYDAFKEKLESLKDKSEFTVQIFYEPEPKKLELKGSVKNYILKQKKLRKRILEEVANFRERFYNQIKEVVDDVRIKEDGKSLLSVSCLVHKDKVKELEALSKKIGKLPKFKVSLSGPWTVCSFVEVR